VNTTIDIEESDEHHLYNFNMQASLGHGHVSCFHLKLYHLIILDRPKEPGDLPRWMAYSLDVKS